VLIKNKKEESAKAKIVNELLTESEKSMVEKRSANQIKPTKSYVEINGQKVDAMSLISDNDLDSLIKKYNIKIEHNHSNKNQTVNGTTHIVNQINDNLNPVKTNN